MSISLRIGARFLVYLKCSDLLAGSEKEMNCYTSGLSSVTLEHRFSCFVRRAPASYRCLPDAHDAVVISRGDACSIRGPGDSRDPIGVTMVRQFMVSCEALPDLHSFVKTGRGELASVGGPGNGGHCVRVAVIGEEVLPRCGLPDLHGLIIAGRSQVLPVGGPGYGTDGIAMLTVCRECGSHRRGYGERQKTCQHQHEHDETHRTSEQQHGNSGV